MLIERYANYIYQAVYGVLQSTKDAEDAAQEAFVQIYLSLPGYERRGLKTWMSRIAVHKAIDWKRKLVRRQEQSMTDILEQALPDRMSSTETVVLNRERSRTLAKRINELPDTFRDVVVDFYMEEKSYQQIAFEQGIELKSVESRLYRARQWMRKNWKEDEWI